MTDPASNAADADSGEPASTSASNPDPASGNGQGRSAGRALRVLLPALLVIAWLAVGGLAGPFAGKLAGVATNDSSSFLPASAESTLARAEAAAFSTSDAVPAIVIAARDGAITAADTGYLTAAVQRIKELPQVDPASVPPPIPSQDGTALQVVVPLVDADQVGEGVDAIRDLLTDDAPDGLTVLVTGPAGFVADLVTAFGGIDGLLLLVAGSVVALILIVVYRSLLLPLIVLLSAVFALALASLIVYLLADHEVITLNGQSQGILFILVFGAATDYALLLISRFREQLRDTEGKAAAMTTAWRATLAPVTASAGTVILGVLCLLFSDLNSNRGLGPVAAIGIACAWLASMTFLPAILALIGRGAFWPVRPRLGSPHPESRGWWARLASRVAAGPRRVWIVTGIALLVCCAFLPQLRASGTSQSDTFLNPVESVTGQRLLEEHFPAGSGSPVTILADAAEAQAVQQAAAVDGVGGVSVLTGRDGTAVTVDGRVQLSAVLDDAPDSEAAVRTVQRIRDAVHAVPGANALVGGQTAIQLDTQQTSERDRLVIMPIVLLVIFVILMLLLRSILAPLLLIGSVVLSFAATMGVTALVFNHLFGFPGADASVPLFGFVFLVALGIDYNIFLMTRVREETLQLGTREGTRRGLSVTGGVITSAGVVLAATFAALAVIPLLFLAQIAFIVAFGVLLDTLVVRTLLVPAAVMDIGPRTWWPSRLDGARRP